jgi:large subunit ribosomal protein L25
MEIVKFEVEKRQVFGKNKVKKLKNTGLIPAVIYGEAITPISIVVEPKKLRKIYKEFGKNVILNLIIKDNDKIQEENVLSHTFDIHPISREYTHIDFLKINMKKNIHTTVPVKCHGLAAGVKIGGVLIHNMGEIEVSCLPNNIPEQIELNIEVLTIGDSIKVKDLKLAEDIEILSSPEDVIVAIEAPKVEKEPEEETAVEDEAEDNKTEEEKETSDEDAKGEAKAKT